MNPYEKLPEKAFWKLAVAQKSMFDIDDLWEPKFDIAPGDKVVSFGSCFARHIGAALTDRGYNWHITERAPSLFSDEEARRFNYHIFSARTGNIYTASLLKQWTQWALEDSTPPGECWEKGHRIYDPFRVRIEPNGFASEKEMTQSRRQTIRSFKTGIVEADYFVFTLGLTESWINIDGGYEYPLCPGTVVGEFDERKHQFVNQQFNRILNELLETINLMRKANPLLKFILTVSPVPLAATKSQRHVLLATLASKSILIAVADQLSTEISCVDYFPAYELINSPVFKGIFFEPNQRSVTPHGVNIVMDSFFKAMKNKFGSGNRKIAEKQMAAISKAPEDFDLSLPDDDYCDEALLGAFAENR
jgi:hypothetical protein